MDNQPAPSPKPRRWGRKLLAAVAIAGIGGVVVAQYHGGYGYNPRWHGGDGYEGRWRGGPDGMPRGYGGGFDRQARFQRFCSFDTSRWHGVARTFVKADLRLSNEQAAEFDRLADGLMPQLEELKKDACANIDVMNAPAPERLKKFADMARKVADIAERNAEPFGKFYALLDAGQKSRIDMMMSRHRGMAGPGMMGPGMGGPGGRMGPGGDQPGDGEYRRPPGYGGDYRRPRYDGDFRGPPAYGGDYYRRGPGWRGYERGDDTPSYPGGGQRWQ